MGQTRWYGMAYFDFGDHLDSEPNPQREIERFVVIDKQIYGLYNIFGNGVINGWWVSDATNSSLASGISVSIGPGIGIIKYIASETTESDVLTNLTANSTLDIFAVLKGSTVSDRAVDFISVLTGVEVDFGIRLATIQTGNNNIIFINNTNRDLVGFKELIKNEVDKHNHTGSMRIDLESETRGQLPGAKIAGIDASKITSGVFDIDRIPIKNHNDLSNNGMITHSGLDSFVRTLSQSNKELLGEINSINLLKSILFWKYINPDVDNNFINELAIIPGISPDTYIDFTASTANINLHTHCISGKPAETGEIVSVFWDDQNSFYYNSYSKNNVLISGGEVTLTREGEEIEVVENFNYSTIQDGSSIPTFTATVDYNPEASVVAETSADYKTEGAISGKFNASSSFKAIYTKEFTEPKKWKGKYDQLFLYVKTSTQNHEPVYFQLTNTVDGVDTVVKTWEIIAKNHITSNSDVAYNNFEEKELSLAGLELDNVTKMEIWTEDMNSEFVFYIDNIFVRRGNIVRSPGNIKFRHTSQTNVVFQTVIYNDAYIPEGTDILVKVKTANSESLLNNASYSNYLGSGDVFSYSGTVCEIDISLVSTLPGVAPILRSVELRMLVNSEGSIPGWTIDQVNEWNRGETFENISVIPTGESDYGDETGDISISDPINIGGFYYAFSNAINEMDTDGTSLIGFSGSLIPISPIQAANWANYKTVGYNYLSSVVRKIDKNFIIVDTNNNRVLEIDRAGNIIKGFGSTYTINSNDLYPLSAIYNNVSGVLSVVFTKAVTVSNIKKIVLYAGASEIALTSGCTIGTERKSGGKVLEISLSDDIKTRVAGLTSGLTVYFEDGAFLENIQFPPITLPLYGLSGMVVSICDFTYIDGIKHPIFANALSNGNWIIANSSVFYKPEEDANVIFNNPTTEDDSSAIADIIEINTEDGSNIFSSDAIKFSDFTLGAIAEYQTNKLIVAGINTGNHISGQPIEITEESSDKDKFRAAAITELGSYIGQIALIDKTNNSSRIIYTSPDGLYPTDLDIYTNSLDVYRDGNILISESSFSDSSGRLIIIDEFSNIVWTYGSGFFNIINDAKVLKNDHIMVSL